MTRSEYARQHAELMRKHGDENHPAIHTLNNQRMNAITVGNAGMIDNSNQTQANRSAPYEGQWDSDRREKAANRKMLQEKADDLEASGKALAQYNHFYKGSKGLEE